MIIQLLIFSLWVWRRSILAHILLAWPRLGLLSSWHEGWGWGSVGTKHHRGYDSHLVPAAQLCEVILEVARADVWLWYTGTNNIMFISLSNYVQWNLKGQQDLVLGFNTS